MKKLLSFVVLCVFSSAMSLAQVSNDNEDGVYKVNKYASRWKEGEVIIKFKDDSGVQTTTSVKGRRTISTKRKVSTVLNNLGLEEMEQLMPLTGNKVSSVKRRIKSGRMVQDTDLSKLVVAKFDKSKASVNEAIEQLKALDEVEFAEPNYVVTICSADDGNTNYDDPLLSDQWGLDAINIQSLWAMPKKETRRPVIAILDTGVDITHPDLAENIWTNSLEADGEEFADDDNNGFYDDVHGWDFVNNTAIIKNGMDGNGHGTHCAGIAAAVGNNGIGVVGANPDAYILPIKVMEDNGSGTISTIIQGIDYAVACGADILSMSIGSAYSKAEEEALLKAYAKYVVCVGAAGNSSADINVEDARTPTPSFPAAFDFVVGVQATQENGDLASFSNYDSDGPFFSCYPSRHDNNADFWNYEVKAPGTNIMSTYPGGKYKKLNGTSMACPMIAGAISRILQVRGYDYAKDYGIYGDIVESKNNEGVFDAQKVTTWTEDNRNVTLRLLSIRVDDTAFGDGDGKLEAGEIIDLYPTVRSVWGYAKNIKVHSFVGNENTNSSVIEYLQDNVDFGLALNSSGFAESLHPIRVKISEDVNQDFNLPLYFELTCDGMSFEEQNRMTEVHYSVNAKMQDINGIIGEDILVGPGNISITKQLGIKSGVTLTFAPNTNIYIDGYIKNYGNLIIKEGCSLYISHTYSVEVNMVPWLDNTGTVRFEGQKENFIKIKDNQSPDYPVRPSVMVGENGGSIYMDYVDAREIRNIIVYKAHNQNVYIKNSNLNQLYYYKDNNCILEGCNIYGWIRKHDGIWEKNTFECAHNCNFLTPSADIYLYDADVSNNYIGKGWCLNYQFDDIEEESSKHPVLPIYVGSNKESVIRENQYIYDYTTNKGWLTADLTPLVNARPSALAPGIIWKLCVDGYDAQDDFAEMPPVGVGDHEIKVIFNKPVNKEYAPNISFGLKYPYDQYIINNVGTWNQEGDEYTTSCTITGKESLDGLNTFNISVGKDLHGLDIIAEKEKYKMLIQAAGSLSTGLIATPGLGKITLDWQTKDTNFEDLLGFNIYRSEYKERVVTYRDPVDRKYKDSIQVYIDTIIINPILIEPGLIDGEGMMTQTYTDYDVIPGKTYYYYVCEMSTDLKSYEASATVSVIPLTASKGDANGSMSVDIADVVTEVAYLTDQNPQPFIFDAADVNEDETINILDVVGTVNIIASPSVTNQSVDNTVTYTIEDGILYVESTTPLGGIQVSVKANIHEHTWFTALEGLDGMEHAGTWLNDNEYMLLAYSMSGKTIPTGKQPILQIGDKDVKNIIVSDPRGHNLVAINGTATSIEELPYGIDECKNAEVRYFDITGRAVSASAAKTKGVYIVSMYVNGKCVKSYKLLNK